MDDCSPKKSASLESLVVQNINNIKDLKAKLSEIIETGKDYEYDVSACIESLLKSNDQDIVLLSVQAVSELAKCDEKRKMYADIDIIDPILNILNKEITSGNEELLKQCCRSLGNLCCDCDLSRMIIRDNDGVVILIKFLKNTVELNWNSLKMLMSKTLLNFAIGGKEFCEAIVQGGLIDILSNILLKELEKEVMDNEMVSTVLLIFSVINENTPEFLFEEVVNMTVLNVLRETTNMEISELCLDHLHAQAEHDTVKILLAKEGGVQLVCSRLEELMQRHNAGDVNAHDSEIETIIKQACDLIIIVLTGDEAMHFLYNDGVGEIYLTMIKWLDSLNYHLLTTSILAIGNFARQDGYCRQMMENKIFDKLLDIFETYHGFAVYMQKEPEADHPIDVSTVTKIQHATLSAIRNLIVPVDNKKVAASEGRAAPILLTALPTVEDHHVAYKLLAAIRMLVDGQEGVAKQLASNTEALSCVARWGKGVGAGAAGEAPRLLAWSVRQLAGQPHSARLVQVEGCVSTLVNMLVVCHSVMQNEAILALTLLAIRSLKKPADIDQTAYDYGKSFATQLISSEIGKHVSILIETNCAKMPVEVAENLLAFLDITCKTNEIASDYRESKVQESLQKFSEARKDLSDDLKCCIRGVIAVISDGERDD